jgi:N-acetylneuraminic acid mutarotase
MLKNHLLIFGGKSTLTKICEDMLVYDIKKNIWQKIGLVSRPHARQDASIINKNGVVYLFGGRNTLKNEFYNDLWKFDFKKFSNSNKININSIENKQIQTFGQVSF